MPFSATWADPSQMSLAFIQTDTGTPTPPAFGFGTTSAVPLGAKAALGGQRHLGRAATGGGAEVRDLFADQRFRGAIVTDAVGLAAGQQRHHEVGAVADPRGVSSGPTQPCTGIASSRPRRARRGALHVDHFASPGNIVPVSTGRRQEDSSELECRSNRNTGCRGAIPEDLLGEFGPAGVIGDTVVNRCRRRRARQPTGIRGRHPPACHTGHSPPTRSNEVFGRT